MELIDVAMNAARKAGEIIRNSYGKLQASQVKNKQLHDYITDVDQHSEDTIINLIRENYPDHTIFAEESGIMQKQSDYRWIIDPLDGTTNYIHGIPVCAVSIAVEYKGKIIVGVIYDPFRNELFHAIKNEGAFLNNQKIKVSRESDLSHCLIATGFPFKRKDILEPYLKVFSAVLKHVSGMRRAGAAALDLAYVACGRLDGFWEIILRPWDMAAGEIIVREAGGEITDIYGEENHLTKGNIIATNKLIHDFILSCIKSEFSH